MEFSAIDWLVKELHSKSTFVSKKLIQQAKELEKQQHQETWQESRVEDMGDNYLGKQVSFNEYYEKTFGNETKTQKK